MVLAGILLTSCHRRPIEEEFTDGQYCDILLLTNWSLLEEVPTGMTAMFFPEDGGTPIVLMSNNTVGNTIRLKAGRYKAVVFNQSIYEFGSMTFDGMNMFESVCARAVGLAGSVTQETIADFNWFCAAVGNNPEYTDQAVRALQPFNADRFTYEVTEEMCRRQYEKEQEQSTNPWGGVGVTAYIDTIHSMPPPVAPTMHVKVNISGINNIYMVRAYITNMARADRFGLHYNTAEEAIHILPSWKVNPKEDDKTRGNITTSFRTFGIPSMKVTDTDLYLYDSPQGIAPRRQIDIQHGRNTLYIEFMLRDGETKVVHDFDVTDNIEYTEQELRLNVELTIDTPLPDVPDVIGSGGAGFDADVEDWKEDDQNIKI